MNTTISGNLSGLKPSQIKALERTLRRRVPPSEVVTQELLSHMLDWSAEARRRMGVLVDRRGHIEHVVVGDAHRIYLPDLGRLRAGAGRFRGVRFIQTQLREQDLSKDDIADLTKLRLDYSVSVFRQPNGRVKLQGAHLLPYTNEDEPFFEEVAAFEPEDLVIGDFFEFVTDLEARFSTTSVRTKTGQQKGGMRAMLIAAGERRIAIEQSADEMRELCKTAGVTIVDETLQTRKQIDPKYVIGHGKIEDVVLRALQQDIELLIFDRELSPTQSRTIADATELKVLDRTQLILDIFAQHAKSEDGHLQVELAQLKYNLPRLSEMSTAMSRLSGGIGGRGPGETKMEINRRRARDRITMLEGKINDLSDQRGVRRQKRHASGLPMVAIVGYTNAGKSTLLNALTQSDVLVEDKLFATLDPASRKLFLAAGREALVSDTVGFIRDLPADLVNAFRATLEELNDADLLLHVVDLSDPMHQSKAAAVESILIQMHLIQKPRIKVWNKADRANPTLIERLRKRDEIVVSAVKKQHLDTLRTRLLSALFESQADPVPLGNQ